MPFLKFSRDKRGYENYYLFESLPGGRRGGQERPRLLFWFRTPPNVKVGRAPFSDEVRRMVEAQNPGVTFDWARLMATPIPPADVEHWRERRRAAKAARRAAREAEMEVEGEETAPGDTGGGAAVVDTAEAEERADKAETPAVSSDLQGAPLSGPRRRRRRRRGRRGRDGQPETPAAFEAVEASPEPPVEPDPSPTNEV